MGQALKWYRKAADQGFVLAQYALGVAQEEGLEGMRSRTKAMDWYGKAADQGMAEAKAALSRLANPFVISAEEAAANLAVKVTPADIPLARVARVRGVVNLRIYIDRKGYVNDVQLLTGHPLLNDGAIETAGGLRYDPFVRDGKIVDVRTTVRIEYSY
jgi:TonB family protein